ncbi:MAG: hypothetical protein JW891_01365 [Candidatus Lokiarchaeota archaeon]|nr:hypothetical protein [Candidatus Lokiarchaeota archaeon]
MNEKEIKLNEKVKEVEKPLIEDKATGVSLGDELLDKEFRMQEAARKIQEEYESKKAD